MTLEEFIAARLDEAEAAAHAAQPDPGARWTAVDDEVYSVETPLDSTSRCDQHTPGQPNQCDDELIADIFSVTDQLGTPRALHIARHEPAAVLDDIAAKRRLLSLFASIRKIFPDYAFAVAGLRMLAMAWHRHPDYQEEWSI